MNPVIRRHGFTLIEMLIGMVILSILMLAFTQIFGSSLRASSEINARNELVSEGQIAQQLIASRLQGAYYVYSGINPDPNSMVLGTSTTTSNTVRGGAGQNWIPNTDPFVAMLLPPTTTGRCPTSSASAGVEACFTFYAYYPIRRATFVTSNPRSAPDADANNADVWLLMEYRANIYDGVDRSIDQLANPPVPGNASNPARTAYTGRSARVLVDFVQPTGVNPTYRMFSICKPSVNVNSPPCPTGTQATDPELVDFNLRLLQNRAGRPLTAPSSNTPLSTRIYPRN